MNWQQFIQSHLYSRTILSWLLFPLSLIYVFIQETRRAVYDLLPFLSYRSDVKIASVGNLVSGGSGKTPVTIFLAGYFGEQGRKVAVSHRGYRSDLEKGATLISDRNRLLAASVQAGDEAQLLARKLAGIPVVAGKNRKQAIRLLTDTFPDLDWIILDDSFQHLQVKHDLDILVFNREGGIGNGFVLPAGILRESPAAAVRAQLIIANGYDTLPAYLNRYPSRIIRGKYRIVRIYDGSGEEIPVSRLSGKKIALFSGIGRPLSFENTVRGAGLEFSHHYQYPDHYSYDDPVLEYLREEVSRQGWAYLLTTEKDYVKIASRKGLALPLAVLAIEFEPEDTEKFEAYIQ